MGIRPLLPKVSGAAGELQHLRDDPAYHGIGKSLANTVRPPESSERFPLFFTEGYFGGLSKEELAAYDDRVRRLVDLGSELKDVATAAKAKIESKRQWNRPFETDTPQTEGRVPESRKRHGRRGSTRL